MVPLCRAFDKDSKYIYDKTNGDWRLWPTAVEKYDFKDKNVITLFTVKLNEL